MACHIGDKSALERLVALRRLRKDHQFALICRDLSELGSYAKVENGVYRILKRNTPGLAFPCAAGDERSTEAFGAREEKDHRSAGARTSGRSGAARSDGRTAAVYDTAFA